MQSVSVIIPCFQSAQWLPATIASCLEQKEFIREIIIIEDHSTDGSWDIASDYQERYPELIRLFRNKGKGGNLARNYGFEISSGEFIQWLDADDQLLGDKLKSQLELFQNDSATDIVYSDWRLHIYEGTRLLQEEEKKQKVHEDFLMELLKNNWSPPHNYLLRRNIAGRLHQIKAWNPETLVAQDREYFTMAALLGAKFSYTPGFFCVYNRWNKHSVSAANRELRYLHHERIYNRFLDETVAQERIPPNKRALYQNIILTQKCLLMAYGSHSSVSGYKIDFSNICWPLVKGYRTTIKLIIVILKLKFQRLARS